LEKKIKKYFEIKQMYSVLLDEAVEKETEEGPYHGDST